MQIVFYLKLCCRCRCRCRCRRMIWVAAGSLGKGPGATSEGAQRSKGCQSCVVALSAPQEGQEGARADVRNTLLEMASKSRLNFLAFLYGSAIGFLLCSQLFNILLGNEGDTQSNVLHKDPHARHSDDNGQNHLEGQMNFNADSSQRKDENIDITENLYQQVKILCWVMTGPQNLEKKAKHVKVTWVQHCHRVFFMSSEEIKTSLLWD